MQRDARYEAIVQMLLDREVEERDAREKRQLRYRQSLDSGRGDDTSESSPRSPTRLERFRTKVPCRLTAEARTLLERLEEQFPRGSITCQQVSGGRQAVMLTRVAGAEPKQIGWVEHCVQTDPNLCNVRDQGLSVEADGGMLMLRFRYAPTAVRMSSSRGAREGNGCEHPRDAADDLAWVDFTEIRPALDMQPSDDGSAPRLAWVTRSEVEMMDALGSRDYEAFYVRFKLEVQAGIWHTLSGLLSSSPGSRWHSGSYYSVVRESDSTNGRIYERTVDDNGSAVSIGPDRIYDASAATDVLLLYLEGDILADVADIYFTLQSLGSFDAHVLKGEFFTAIRRFWATTPSLASCYGNEVASVIRMSQRAVPTPAQALLLKQDWTNLRQSLVDRYGEGGRHAPDIVGANVHRPSSAAAPWPFTSFRAGQVNLGLRFVYRQEWKHSLARRVGDLGSDESPLEQSNPIANLDDAVADAARAVVQSMKWTLEVDGSINTGVRGLAANTDMGLEWECRESSRDTSVRLTDIMQKVASRNRDDAGIEDERFASSLAYDSADRVDPDAATRAYSSAQNRYEVRTRPAEVQNVVLIAESLPTPAEIDLSWVKQHGWILAKVLLDESFRDALTSISPEAQSSDTTAIDADQAARDGTTRPVAQLYGPYGDLLTENVDALRDASRGSVTTRERACRDAGEARTPLLRDANLDAMREALYEHIRANILHYQRAIWQQEDPQQRSMRYRKSGKKVPLDWQFELESAGAITISEFIEKLTASNANGQFAAYSSGRAVDLDKVIDPAGPIGYYANYAIYHMRPEFGSEDLFAMLHFFKSPYLRPNAETGEAEVADPMQIEMSEVADAPIVSEEVFELYRDEMFTHLPDVLLEVPGCQPPEGYQLIMESGSAIQTLSAHGQPAQEAEWAIVRSGNDHTPSLLVGIAPLDREKERLNPARNGEEERLIPARNGDEALAAKAVTATAQTHEWLIFARDDEERTLSLQVGTGVARAPVAAHVILEPDGAEQIRGLLAGAGHVLPPATAQVIMAAGDGQQSRGLLAGSARAPDRGAERVIFARDDAGLRPSLLAG